MYGEGKYKRLLGESKLILFHQPHNDDFIRTMTAIFHGSCWFGVVGTRRRGWILWFGIILILMLVIECQAVWKVTKALAGWATDTAGNRSVTGRIAGAIFYMNSIVALILSTRLSFGWKRLSAFWASVERATPTNVPPDRTLSRRLKLVFVLISLCTILEHGMTMIKQIEFDCPPSLILERYTLRSHGFILLSNDYSIWLAIPIFFISKIAKIMLNYQSAVIILISMGLTSRYHRLNQYVASVFAMERTKIKRKQAAALNVYTWRKIREAYVKQSMLVRKVNSAVGYLIIVSSFRNFYSVTTHIFLGITQGQRNDAYHLVFYLISVGWVITRTSFMMISAANVHTYSKRALNYLYHCDSSYFNIEIERLQYQLSKDYVVLTGRGFFSLNRKLLLQMVGAVVTYELMLLQFDNKEP